VAEPWWHDDAAQSLRERGYVPRLTTLRAFFPARRRLRPHCRAALGPGDLSLLRCNLRGARLPTLPLDRSGAGAVAGQASWSSASRRLEALLAKADAEVVRTVLERAGRSEARVTEALAERGLVRPSTTQATSRT